MGGMGSQSGSLMILRASFMPRRSAGMPVLKHLSTAARRMNSLQKVAALPRRNSTGVIVAVNLHVAGQITAVAHDVVTVGVARRVELALAGDVPVRDGAGALEHHVGNNGGGKCWLAT